MIPSVNQQSQPAATDASPTGVFADPAYRARVREQARALKEMSLLPRDVEMKAVELPGRIRELQRQWQEAFKLGFKLTPEDREGFERQLADLNVHDVQALGKVTVGAIGLTESLARAMNALLPPDERLNCEWSSPEWVCGVRLVRGAISRVHGVGGTTWIEDSRILQFHRMPAD